jgi:hypothetical protein
MANIITAVMALLITAVFVLVYMNRASSEVVGAALPVAFGAVSALALVFAFGKPAPVERTFPVVFIVQKSDQAPMVIPNRPFDNLTLAIFSQAIAANPKLLDNDARFKSLVGGPLYHYYLQKAIINWLSANYWYTWRTRVQRFQAGAMQQTTGPARDAADFASHKLSKEEVQSVLTENPFASVPPFGPGTLALPPRTRLTVTEPHHDPRQGEIGDIRMKNWLCDVRITTRESMKSVGVGSYMLMLPVDQMEAQNKYTHALFVTEIEATFSPWLRGHPQMNAHREWVEGMVEGLVFAFDEESIWRRTTESYLLLEHTKNPNKDRFVGPMGPIHSQPPTPRKP